MKSRKTDAITLGEKLRSENDTQDLRLVHALIQIVILGILGSLFYSNPSNTTATLFLATTIFFFLISRWDRVIEKRDHPLIANDKHGFMASLKQAEKTVLIDGHNIYHFGLKQNVGAGALMQLAQRRREDGYRIVCFFDANIFYTLQENRDFVEDGRGHLIKIIVSLFGLMREEIYVVPAGIQADTYIIKSLAQLPVSFALTNDEFRNYEEQFDFLAKDGLWRKGVDLKGR